MRISPPLRGASCATESAGRARRTASDSQATDRIKGAIAESETGSGLRGLVAHGIGVLFHLRGGQILFLPLPDLVEAREPVDVGERVPLEALVEVRLGDGPALLQLAGEVVDSLDRRPKGRPGENG